VPAVEDDAVRGKRWYRGNASICGNDIQQKNWTANVYV